MLVVGSASGVAIPFLQRSIEHEIYQGFEWEGPPHYVGLSFVAAIALNK